jgi:hypothetical protein
MTALKTMKVLENSTTMRVGIFRGEFSNCPDSTIIQNWISWIDPYTASPDFHTPRALGILRIVI